MEKFKLGLVGCGGMMKTHVQAVTAMEEVEIVALCDIIRERAEEVATIFPDAFITTDYREFVGKVDGVLIALPHDLHYECGVFFARNHIHVLMEKPLCNTEEECLSLIDICEKEKVTLMCAYPVRFWEGIVKLKEEIDSGKYGEIMTMSVWTEQLTGLNYLDENPLPWFSTARLGGGQFFSHGCHYVDIMLWFLGNPVKGMHFGTRNGTPWLLREGTSMACIQFENGAIGYHGATWGARGTRLGYDFQIHTEKGMLEYIHETGEIRLYNNQAPHVPGEQERIGEYRLLWKREGARSKQTQFEIAHFVDCVRNNKVPLTNGKVTLQGLRCIWKMYEAERNNTIADLRGLGLDQI